ncbi:hypothetical protein [Polyangium jinanense]|uniref:Uncharacterized protein n=1 Tax=Polyangium jinanense TaxID=2829994 RepID=A0A9X3X6M9_9BACT|nr:hypothetical protein [Polyangium jinanense]MDC3957571.1 hypothetical protein [Polyangium jinanense]MDC3984647.1 hypothetical protein [Polyangium jinanense]
MTHAQDDLTLARTGGVLVLRDNTWSDCAIDGMRGDFRRLTSPGTRGFCNVSSGRHHVVTNHEDEPIVLDLVLYPGETLVRRLDVDEREFVLDDPETEKKYLALAAGGSRGAMASALVDYEKAIIAARGRAPELLPDEIARRVGAVFVTAAEQAALGVDQGVLMEQTYKAGLELIGHVMLFSHIQKFVGLFSMSASKHAMEGHYELAARITLLGLSILPGEPWLLDLLANLYSDGGAPVSALPFSEEALRRAHVLPEKLAQQIRATYAEISVAAQGS